MLELNTFNKAYIFLPFCNVKSAGGGLIVARQLAALLNKHLPTEIVTYQDQEPGIPFAPAMTKGQLDNSLCIITWGPHINRLLHTLSGQKVVYYAQSFGWDISLTAQIPILCVSRYVMTQWSRKAPANPVFLMPPVLGKECTIKDIKRDIDILIISRKSSDYLMNTLLPELKKRHQVHVQNDHIPQHEIYQLFNRSKIYIYSTPVTLGSGGQEGFGLQPLEALVCGCRVFSNINGGLCDYLEPSSNMSQLSGHLLAYDLHRIGMACASSQPEQQTIKALAARFSAEAAHQRLRDILPELDSFYTYITTAPTSTMPGN